MNYVENEWRSADGTPLFACEWTPSGRGEVKAVVGLVHGMGEHMGRYRHVAAMLTEEGYAVLGFDNYGHGKTPGKRGHAPSYDALLSGIDLMRKEAADRYPGLPVFLYGHSMGGNVTLNYLLRRKPALAGAIVTGPWLKLAFQPPVLQAAVGKVLERLYPKFTNSRPMNAEHLTTDPELMKRYVEDELGHGDITAGFFFGVQRAGSWALQHAGELQLPLLLMHGGSDKVTSIHASRQFAEKAGPLCEFLEWPGFRHELQNELKREEVFAVMRGWLRNRLEAFSGEAAK
ncbi:alpha/beta hydrolase [Paenibacillus aurantius]|uniref:Alpha/beta hydrolase n=1 Tax=Paenibacillus aurantius TaxID=2918900 RepID=A0AA96LDE3_9BACL|nr:lysophospholipase [Paenibacillus aurantius]WNQ11280.1 alpha/beta hydrolase [Paenibacillus aurantius]